MIRYIAKRLLHLIPTFIGITIISFMVIHLAPGKPTDLVTQLNPKISMEAKEQLTKLYGLDKPIHEQYFHWMSKIVRLDLGESFIDGRKVTDKIAERIPITLLINVLALGIVLIFGSIIGITSAVKEGQFYDRLMTVLVFIGFAAPTFWLALLLMKYFSVDLGWFPVSGLTSLDFEKFTLVEKIIDVAHHLILPVFVAGFFSLAGISRYMRTSMLSTLQEDYVRTARAKGLSERTVIYKHALRNALLPIVTILGLSIPGLIGGSVIFESIFAIPGMGRLFYEGVMARDYPVIMGILVIGAILTLLGNLIADVSYALVDPRIRLDKD